MPIQPFDTKTRHWILHSYFPLDEIQDALPLKISGPQRAELYRRLHALSKQYRAGLHSLPLSRCPFCQSVQSLRIDPIDLDGLWWSGNTTTPETPCFHYWVLSGAVRLAEVIAPSSLLVTPGPQVPFVVPHVLQNPAIRVVISSFLVGSHTAYPIFYYSEVKPIRVNDPFPDWCSINSYQWMQQEYIFERGEASMSRLKDRADFNLAPWIEAGKILWIAPGDESLTLQSGVADCPYLNLSNSQEFSKIQSPMMYSRRFGWFDKSNIDLDAFWQLSN